MSDIEKCEDDALRVDREGDGAILTRETTIILLDASGSMDEEFGPVGARKVKMEAAKEATTNMLTKRMDMQREDKTNTDQMGLITFPDKSRGRARGDDVEESADMLIEPCYPKPEQIARVNSISASGGTPLLRALKSAQSYFARGDQALLRIIVISDGTPSDPEGCLALAKSMVEEFGIVIDTIGVGEAPTEPHKFKKTIAAGERAFPQRCSVCYATVSSEEELKAKGLCRAHSYGYDEEFMRNLSAVGAGNFVHVSNADALDVYLGDLEAERRLLMPGGVKLLQAGPIQ